MYTLNENMPVVPIQWYQVLIKSWEAPPPRVAVIESERSWFNQYFLNKRVVRAAHPHPPGCVLYLAAFV